MLHKNTSVKKFFSYLKIEYFFVPLLLILIFLRRGDLLFKSSDVWSEDGVVVLPQIIQNGIYSFFEPVNGYLLTISKIISFLSLTISPLHYPSISIILSITITIFLLTLIYKAPITLKNKLILIIAPLLIPTDPEVLGLPLYVFWWSGLFLIFILFWDPEKKITQIYKITFIISSLSTVIGVLIGPLLFIKLFFNSSTSLYKNNKLFFNILFATFVIQIYLIFKNTYGLNDGVNYLLEIKNIDQFLYFLNSVVLKFFGSYLTSNKDLYYLGYILLFFIIYGLFKNSHDLNLIFIILLIFGSIILSIIRQHPDFIDPITAGPRYFFYPFIMISYYLIHLYSLNNSNRILVIIFLLFSILNLSTNNAFKRTHDDLEWKKHLISCMYYDDYNIPIHNSGNKSYTSYLYLNKYQCKNFGISKIYLKKVMPFPFKVFNNNIKNYTYNYQINNKNEIAGGSNYDKLAPLNTILLGTYKTSDADVGNIEITIPKKTKLYFQSGPKNNKNLKYEIIYENKLYTGILPVCTEWCILSFELFNSEFTLKLIDQGKNWGEWIAIALPNKE